MIQVFGHKAPDTDSTGSPLIWAWYLSEVRKTPARAVLQGMPNTEAVWMLGKWGVAMPEIIEDVAAGDQCVIVDTNNPAELPASLDKAEVIEPSATEPSRYTLTEPPTGYRKSPRPNTRANSEPINNASREREEADPGFYQLPNEVTQAKLARMDALQAELDRLIERWAELE